MSFYFCVMPRGQHIIVRSLRGRSGIHAVPDPTLLERASAVVEFPNREDLIKERHVVDLTSLEPREVRDYIRQLEHQF